MLVQHEVQNPYPTVFSRFILEAQHWRSTKLLRALEVRDPHVPTSYDKAIVLSPILINLSHEYFLTSLLTMFHFVIESCN